MSKSRLEKFLYALYSLDSSDLPTPLSRIEELYKCLVTGDEAPTFEPLSRVEKYLMAILGVCDADSLPNPISRVEVLLYKLAIGDDNLDDVKSFLSEHEELLADIIRNGGVGGSINIEYVLYTLSTEFSTLYNTTEKPVKSAILMGKTINNLWSKLVSGVVIQQKTDGTIIENYSEQYNRITFGETQVNSATTIDVETTQQLQANKTYYINTFVFDGFYGTDSFLIRDISNNINLETLTIEDYPTGQILSFTTQGETNRLKFYYFAHSRKYGGVNYSKPFYMPKRFIISDKLEDVVNQEFFKGMQSVKMPVLTTTGKNLLPRKTIYNNISFRGLTVNTENNRVRVSGTATGICDIEFFNINTMSDDEYIKVKPNTKYILSATLHSGSISGNLNLACKSIADDGTIRWLGSTFTTNSNESKVNRIRIAVPLGFVFNDAVISLQLEESTVATSYEPYKSNSLTVNEDVVLRRNGDVYDELNLLTGRLTQRIDENNEVLSQEVVKTVDLSVVNQDGNNTKLSTFNDITHVTLSSEGIIPEAELEVTTKNEEDLEKVPEVAARMLTISREQEIIDTTVNEQSENVDATMLAMTEIYEELL